MADSATPAPDAAQTAQSSDADKIVCKNLDAPTGSRLGTRRECKTQKEWDEAQQRAQQELQRTQSNGYKAGIPGG